jgi:hypothetical protein
VADLPPCWLLAGEVSSHFSCENGNQPLLHGVPNEQVKTVIIILVLVDVVREPIDWLKKHFVLSAQEKSRVIFCGANLQITS